MSVVLKPFYLAFTGLEILLRVIDFNLHANKENLMLIYVRILVCVVCNADIQ